MKEQEWIDHLNRQAKTQFEQDDVVVPKPDPVNHPTHYNGHPSGIECIAIAEHFNFNVGNAIKYLWRHEKKGNPIEDLRKAAIYINREIERIEKSTGGD